MFKPQFRRDLPEVALRFISYLGTVKYGIHRMNKLKHNRDGRRVIAKLTSLLIMLPFLVCVLVPTPVPDEISAKVFFHLEYPFLGVEYSPVVTVEHATVIPGGGTTVVHVGASDDKMTLRITAFGVDFPGIQLDAIGEHSYPLPTPPGEKLPYSLLLVTSGELRFTAKVDKSAVLNYNADRPLVTSVADSKDGDWALFYVDSLMFEFSAKLYLKDLTGISKDWVLMNSGATTSTIHPLSLANTIDFRSPDSVDYRLITCLITALVFACACIVDRHLRRC
jgi:hypothetical protein